MDQVTKRRGNPVISAAAAAHTQEILAEVAELAKVRGITRELMCISLNADGFKTYHGKPWTKRNLKHLLYVARKRRCTPIDLPWPSQPR